MIKWTCVYCGQKQETPDLLPIEGEIKPYSEIIGRAAKDESVACQECFHWLMRKLR